MPVTRSDYNLPFGVDPASRQVRGIDYPTHVEQMIQQVLFTAPGERADLPQFGCGLSQLIFAPLSSALAVNTEINVRQALEEWLAGVITVGDVTALTSDDPGGPADPTTLVITISYTVIDTLTGHHIRVILP